MNDRSVPGWEATDPTALELRAAAEVAQAAWEQARSHYREVYQRRTLHQLADPAAAGVRRGPRGRCEPDRYESLLRLAEQ